MKKSFIALLIFFGLQLIGSSVALLIANSGSLLHGEMPSKILMPSPEASGVVLFFTSILTIFLLIASMVARHPRTLRGHWHVSAASLLPVLSVLLFSVGTSLVIVKLGLPDFGTTAGFEQMKGNVLCLLTMCVVGPVAEEYVFRESILRNLPNWRGSRIMAVVVSAAVFGIIHGNPLQAVSAFSVGFMLGLLFVGTGNVLLCSLGHILNNSMAVLSFYYPQIDHGIESISAPVSISVGTLLCLLSFGLLAIWWRRESRQQLFPTFKS